jgi:cell division protein FtsB
MPPARSAVSTPRSGSARRASPAGSPSRPRNASAAGFAPRQVRSRAPLSRIRWDRAARGGLLAILALIAYLWITGVAGLLASHAQAERGLAQVRRLAAQNRTLLAEERSLSQRATILAQARQLGMVERGEQSFIITH